MSTLRVRGWAKARVGLGMQGKQAIARRIPQTNQLHRFLPIRLRRSKSLCLGSMLAVTVLGCDHAQELDPVDSIEDVEIDADAEGESERIDEPSSRKVRSPEAVERSAEVEEGIDRAENEESDNAADGDEDSHESLGDFHEQDEADTEPDEDDGSSELASAIQEYRGEVDEVDAEDGGAIDEAYAAFANEVRSETICGSWSKQLKGGFFGKDRSYTDSVYIPTGKKLLSSWIETRKRVGSPRVVWKNRPSVDSTGVEYYELLARLDGGFVSDKVSTRACFKVGPDRRVAGRVLDSIRYSKGAEDGVPVKLNVTVFADGKVEGTLDVENWLVFASRDVEAKIALLSSVGRVLGEGKVESDTLGACWFGCPSRYFGSFRFDFSDRMSSQDAEDGVQLAIITDRRFTSLAGKEIWRRRDEILRLGGGVIKLVKAASGG